MTYKFLATPLGRAWLVVFLGIQVAWYLKHYWFIPNFVASFQHSIHSHPMFSGLSLDPNTSLIAYFLPMATLPFLLLKNWKWTLVLISSIMAVASLFLVTHIYGFNDATFVSCFWVSIWLAYVGWPRSVEDDDTIIQTRSIDLAKRIVALFFLGGAIGKLTTGYWDGTVLYQLYFQGKPYAPFTDLRDMFSSDTLMTISIWFSRMVIVTELALATTLLWKTKYFAPAVVAVTIGMIFISKIQLFSVLGPFVAMAIVVAYLDQEMTGEPSVERKLLFHAILPKSIRKRFQTATGKKETTT